MYYGCMSYHLRGRHACPNNQTIPMDVANAAFLRTIRDDVLTPALVDQVIVRALELYQAEPGPEHRRTTLENELRRIELEMRRYTDAIGQGEPLPSVLEALRERERRRADVRAQLEHLEGLERATMELNSGGLRKELTSRLTDWQGLLERQPVVARQMLRKLLVGRLMFTPRQDEHGAFYEFSGQASYGRLLAGIVNTNLVVPPG